METNIKEEKKNELLLLIFGLIYLTSSLVAILSDFNKFIVVSLTIIAISSLFVSLYYHRCLKKSDIRSGELKVAGKAYHFIGIDSIVFFTIGSLLFLMSIRVIIVMGEFIPSTLIFGITSLVVAYEKIVRYFVVLKYDILIVKGIEYDLKKIKAINWNDREILISKKKTLHSVELDKLDDSVKEEILDLLNNSKLKEKINTD